MHDKRAITHDVLDRIGFGPSSLSFAICAQDHGAHRTWLFVEQPPQIQWHPGMLFHDLVSLRNPASAFFVWHFINLNQFGPTRLEYRDHLRWVASHFADQSNVAGAVGGGPLAHGVVLATGYDRSLDPAMFGDVVPLLILAFRSQEIFDELRASTPDAVGPRAATGAPPKPFLDLDELRRHVRIWADAGWLRSGAPRVLSFAQERMWLRWKLAPTSPAYHIPLVIKLTGRLELGALLDSLRWLAWRHEVLRSRFVGGPDGVTQIIDEADRLDVRILELEGECLADREQAAQRHLQDEANQPFDLERAAPFVVRLYRLDVTVHWVLIKLHQIVMDASSVAVVLRDLAASYAPLARGAVPAFPAAPAQYRDVAAWQRERLRGAYRDRLLAYWKAKLAADLPPLRLPGAEARPRTASLAGERVAFQLPPKLTARLRELARSQHVTMFMVLLGVFRILLYRYTGQLDIQIGSPTICRNHPDADEMIGCFGNTLVLRSPLDPADTYADVLARERGNALAAYEHQELPFEVLVQELAPARAFDRNPLFQVMLSFTDGEPPAAWSPELQAEVSEVETGTAKRDLLVSMQDTEGTLAGVIEYASAVFDRAAAERMAGHIEVLADDLARHPDRNIGATPLVTPEERTTLLETWNATARGGTPPGCLHELFEAQAAAAPLAIAVRFGEQAITYAQLNRDANRIAHLLVNQGVRPGDLVALCARRSPALVAAVLGILKAGAAYVPIDPRYPHDRIAVVLAEARTCLLVTERELVAGLPLAGPPVVVLDDAPAGDLDDLGRRAGPDDLAYVLFTSGSTGPPKGVMIEHRNTTALLAWAYSVYGDADLACVLAATSICFDLSVFELFVPLCAGHAVALAENVLELPALPARDHVTLINTVPSVMKALLRAPDQRFPDALRVVNLAGGRLDASLVDLVYRRTGAQRVYDLYGPTEATTCSTFQLRLPEQPASIGRPIANTRCYVLDPHGSPVPVGVVGELCLAGAGLARGYLHRPALTAERFTRPRSAWIGETRLYHTGDLVRYTAAGDLEYFGRNDDQLKIAGAPGETIA